MKWITKMLIILGLFVFLIFVLFAGIKYRTSYAKTEIETLVSDDGERKLVIYQIGEPDWPFGSTHCRFMLYENEKKITKWDFDIRDDGASANRGNFDTRWENDKVVVNVSGSEQEDVCYYMFFNGSIDIK